MKWGIDMKQKLAILLALLGLGMSQPLAAIQASESSEISTSAVNNSQDESPSKEKGSRQNPIPVGEVYDYVKKSREGAESHLSFTILESWRGAQAEKQLQQLAPSYQATYKSLDDDQELLLLHLKLAYKSGDENHEEYTNAGIIDPFFDLSGSGIPNEFVADLPDDLAFDMLSLYPGNEHDGYLVAIVPKDTQLIFSYFKNGLTDRVFFQVEKGQDTTIPTKEVQAESPEQAQWGTKEKPVPFTETKPINYVIPYEVSDGGYGILAISHRITVLNAWRGDQANQKAMDLLSPDDYQHMADDMKSDQEFLVLHMESSLAPTLEDKLFESSPSKSHLSLVDSQGQDHVFKGFYQFKKARDQYELRYMLGGGSVKGYVILPAPKGENLLLKVKNEFANKEIYFEIGSKNP